MFDKLKRALQESLCVFDVSSRQNDNRFVLGTKQYQTAVGVKEATVWLVPYPDCHHLCGNYESEGRNILSTTTRRISDAEPELLEAAVASFMTEVDALVGCSYAVRCMQQA
jgi:hypothetical protein